MNLLLMLRFSEFTAALSVGESVNYLPSEFKKLTYQEIGFNSESILYIISSFLQFFLKPYPWAANASIYVYSQALENIVILLIITHLIFKLYKNNKSKCIFWVFTFILTCIPYAIIVANDGTLSRYRFSIIFPFLIIFIYENTKELIKKNEKL